MDQCVFYALSVKLCKTISVFKLCLFINCFTELATWGSSSRFLPEGLSQPIQPQLLLHELKAWRQGHFDLYSKQKTTCFNFLFTPWPQRQSLFLLFDGDGDYVFVFLIALTFLWNANLHIYKYLEIFWIQNPKYIYFLGKVIIWVKQNHRNMGHILQNYYRGL